MTYVYGIDLGQSLNYTAIVVTDVNNKKIRISAIRKFKNQTYPQLQELLFDDLFKSCPPNLIMVDYTNERSFAETIEAKFTPSFANPSSSGYKSWRIVQPVTFNQTTKLEMKQNSREIFEKKQFAWPRKSLTNVHAWSLIDEMKEQMLREFAAPGANGQLKFPKPEGFDNDLIIALELNLYGAKRFLRQNIVPFVSKSYNQWEKYICLDCKNGNHPNTIHLTYYDDRGLIDCTCWPCNGKIPS